MATSEGQAASAPIFDVDERQDVKVFYHNVAYKANRMAINVEKMKVCYWSRAVSGPNRPASQQCCLLLLCRS
jgi:hypothetical protein